MKLNKFRKHGSLYVKLLMGITLAIVIVLMASSSIYYVSFTRILQEKAFQSDLIDLQNTANSIANTTEHAQTVSFQIYRNSTIAKILYYNDPHPFDIQGAMLDLSSYLNAMPFIESISVYNAVQNRYYIVSRNGQRGVISSDAFTDEGLVHILHNYRDYKPFAPIPRAIESNSQQEQAVPVYTYLCYDAIRADGLMNSAIAVNISAEWINQGIEAISSEWSQQIYFVDQHGAVRSMENLVELPTSDLSSFLSGLIPEEIANYTISSFNGEKSLLTYTARDPFDWYYVRVSPYQLIIADVQQVGVITIKIASIILIVGLLFSWLLSKYLYAPINQIKVRMEDLETEWRNSSYTIRQNSLHKLLQIQGFDSDQQLEKLRRIGIQFNFTKPYHLLLIRIDQYEQLKLEHSGDVLTYKFAIMNIGTEICSKHFQVEALDMEDDCLLLFCNVPGHSLMDNNALELILSEVQNACSEYLRIGITIAVSPLSNDPYLLYPLFKQTKEASLHRFFKGRGSIIHVKPYHTEQTTYNFPIGKEKKLMEALKTGKSEEAKQIFDEIMNETQQYPLHNAQLTIKHLTAALENMISDIEKNGSLQLGLDSDIHIPNLKDYETLEELSVQYHELFEKITYKLHEKRSSKQEDLTRRIKELIEHRYADPNLSLNAIADELNMSSYHISRVYRQHNPSTIVDTINQVRMSNAQLLLTEGDTSVAEIAIQTGYTSSSYFHRMFKKLYGVTPAEFRNAHRTAVTINE